MTSSKPLVVVTLLFLAACGGGSSHLATDAGSSVGDGDAGFPEDDPKHAIGGDTRSICNAFIACVGYSWGGDRAETSAAYGPGGTCFQGFSDAECRAQCLSAIAGLHHTYSEEACNVCDVDGQCTEDLPFCNAQTHRCFECKDNFDCKDPMRPTCETSSGRCGNCLTRADCAGTYYPACNPDTLLCSPCDSNADCEMFFKNSPTCDVKTHGCTLCLTDADCERISQGKTHLCKPLSDGTPYCHQCRNNADCPADKPFCDDSNYCYACKQSSDCIGWGGDKITQFYCNSDDDTCQPCTPQFCPNM